jgi:hypothetical protein
MISDSTPEKVCKKCGWSVVYWNEDETSQIIPVNVIHDYWWSSNKTDPEYIDPNYVPR